MRQKVAKSLAKAILTVFVSLASIEAVGAAPMHPTLPPLVEVSSSTLQVAQNRVPSVNGYRGSSKARPGYIKSSNGYWYPSRAFDDYTGSIRRPTDLGNTCNYGFAPTNGSSSCNY
ncbi:cell surface protein [Rhizobium sp. NZLR10]|uniref:cell surface protein n=1 Tax=Rhizobium sp. NZLR10 TaxID=2731097 RepID=UPI001C835FCC|nr:cell surface protein [Rhizobium sp. NZLR10]MBX5196156.1 cell surface protein [Rhizobium sp. NZLR10]